MKYQFKTNIMCGSCVAKITPHLNENDKIKNWTVDTQNPNKVLTIETDILSEENVKEVIQNAGFNAELLN